MFGPQQLHDQYAMRLNDKMKDWAKAARRLAKSLEGAAANAEQRAAGEGSYSVGHMMDTRRMVELEGAAKEIWIMEEMVQAMKYVADNSPAAAAAEGA